MEAYARDVVDGRIIACKWVKLAGRRHLRWLREQRKHGLRWDWAAAEIVIEKLHGNATGRPLPIPTQHAGRKVCRAFTA